jgi:hypothetical protein
VTLTKTPKYIILIKTIGCSQQGMGKKGEGYTRWWLLYWTESRPFTNDMENEWQWRNHGQL